MDCAHDLLTISSPVMVDSFNNYYANSIRNQKNLYKNGYFKTSTPKQYNLNSTFNNHNKSDKLYYFQDFKTFEQNGYFNK